MGNVYEDTLEELEVDYNNNVEEFINNLDERIEIGKYLNNKYSCKFNPINIDYLYKQKEILLNKTFKLDIEKDKYDSVNKPYHYTSGKFECLDVMRDIFGDKRVKTWCILNAFKYLYRCYKKNGEEDIEKANFYLNYVIKNFKEIN